VASLQLKLLGGFAARLPSGRVVAVRGKKNQALLAYLAINVGEELPRTKLINLLWSDRDDSHAHSSLRQALFSLRRDLAGIDPAPLVSSGESITASVSGISTDVASFERLVTSGSVADLRLAAKLYEGDLLDGVIVHDPAFEDWLGIERARFREMIMGVLRGLLPHLAGAEAILFANQLIALDLVRESSHRALMRIYVAQGQFEPAIRQYHICRDVLWRDLQIRPTTETEALYRKLLDCRNGSNNAGKLQRVPRSERFCGPTEVALPPANVVDAAGTQLDGRPSIAVLPFANMSGDPEQVYFSDGVTEDIITELSRFRELHVVARDSSFQFRSEAADPKSVAGRLGVGFVVSGSVRRLRKTIRIQVQLIDAVAGDHLWVDRFDGDAGDAAAFQDEVIQTIVAKVTGQVEVVEAEQARGMQWENMTAYDCLLRGREYARSLSRAETARARYWFEKALEHDPNYAAALALLARSKGHESLFHAHPSAELVDEALLLARRAVALDPNDSLTHNALAIVHLDGLSHGRGSHAVAAQELETALRLNPNNPDLMMSRALQCTYSGQASVALRLVEKAERLNPSLPNGYLSNRGFALFQLRRYAEAAEALERVTSPAHWDHYYLAACYANLGRQFEARLQIAKTLEKAPYLTLSSFRLRCWYSDSVDLEHALDGLRKAGLPD
jgi:TolB-like protein/DNA-binding SARP family transcriptional activator/Flp pilus assembly protein TadD